jgi:hypothetical protein
MQYVQYILIHTIQTDIYKYNTYMHYILIHANTHRYIHIQRLIHYHTYTCNVVPVHICCIICLYNVCIIPYQYVCKCIGMYMYVCVCTGIFVFQGIAIAKRNGFPQCCALSALNRILKTHVFLNKTPGFTYLAHRGHTYRYMQIHTYIYNTDTYCMIHTHTFTRKSRVDCLWVAQGMHFGTP